MPRCTQKLYDSALSSVIQQRVCIILPGTKKSRVTMDASVWALIDIHARCVDVFVTSSSFGSLGQKCSYGKILGVGKFKLKTLPESLKQLSQVPWRYNNTGRNVRLVKSDRRVLLFCPRTPRHFALWVFASSSSGSNSYYDMSGWSMSRKRISSMSSGKIVYQGLFEIPHAATCLGCAKPCNKAE